MARSSGRGRATSRKQRAPSAPCSLTLARAASQRVGAEFFAHLVDHAGERAITLRFAGRHLVEQRELHACVARHELRRSEEHTSELQSQSNLVCRLLLEKKKNK